MMTHEANQELPMKKQTVFFEAFEYNKLTGEVGRWRGTATPATIAKLGLAADLSYPLYADESVAVDGWGYKAP
jgi:hypothetical protein